MSVSKDNLLEFLDTVQTTSAFNNIESSVTDSSSIVTSEGSQVSEDNRSVVLESASSVLESAIAVLRSASSVLDTNGQVIAILHSDEDKLKMASADCSRAECAEHGNGTVIRFTVSEEGQSEDSGSSASSPSPELGCTSVSSDTLTANGELEEDSVKCDNITVSVQRRVSHYQHALIRKYAREFRVLETVFLMLMVLVLFGFYVLPTVYFINPPLPFTIVADRIQFTGTNCSAGVPYTGKICSQEFSGTNLSPVTVTVPDQEIIEVFVTISFHDVHLFDPSPECEVAYRSFLCLYLFGACDSNSSLLATQATCSHVRDGVCEREWREIDSFLRPRGLPVCEEELPEGHLTEYTGNESVTNIPFSSEPLNCSQFFFYNASLGLCRPSCEWGPHADQISHSILHGLDITAAVIFFLFASLNILSALTVERHTLLKFPVVYTTLLLNISAIILGISITLSDIDHSSLTCKHQDYVANIVDSQFGYCSVFGIMSTYFFIQLVLWFLFHSLAMFWSTYFPFSYREAKANGRFKPIFITTLIISVFGPLISLLYLKDGLYASNFFASFCTPQNPNILFAVTTLPLSLLLWLNSSLFILIAWRIFKDLILCKVGKKKRKQRCGTAELAVAKLLTTSVYITISMVLALSVNSFSSSVTPSLYLIALLPYFTCESTGHDPTKDCLQYLSDIQQPGLFNLSLAYRFTLGLLPLVIFLIYTNFKLYVTRVKQVYVKLKRLRSNDFKLADKT